MIAEELSISINTVKTHTSAIYRKLGVSSREDALGRAIELGLV
jgi:LuxR family maltose regulon positive regulatory protein